MPSLSKRNKKDSFVSLSVSKPSARISSCGSRVSYGLSFIYGARFQNVYSCWAAAGTELDWGKGDMIEKKRLISKPFCLQALLPPLTERYSLASWMVYLLSLPFQTRGEPLFFLSNALREYPGLTIWPHNLALRQYALRARKSFVKLCHIESRNFLKSHAAEIAYIFQLS